MSGGISLWQLLIIIMAILYPFVIFRIVSKAGYRGWWALVIFVPVLNLIMLWVFAFAKWPVEQDQTIHS